MPSIRFWALYRSIGQLEAEQDLRALAVAITGANPGEHGRLANEMARQLQDQAQGRRADQGDGYGMPTAALRGPNVAEVESSVIRARYDRMAAQVEEQRDAWTQGGWPALAETLARQQAENRTHG